MLGVRFSFFSLGNFLPICCHRDDDVARVFGTHCSGPGRGGEAVFGSFLAGGRSVFARLGGWTALVLWCKTSAHGGSLPQMSLPCQFSLLSVGQCRRNCHWAGIYRHPSQRPSPSAWLPQGKPGPPLPSSPWRKHLPAFPFSLSCSGCC